MHVNKVSYVQTVDRVAKHLREDDDFLHDAALEMEPDAGVICVYGLEDKGVLAFTGLGGESLSS